MESFPWLKSFSFVLVITKSWRMEVENINTNSAFTSVAVN